MFQLLINVYIVLIFCSALNSTQAASSKRRMVIFSILAFLANQFEFVFNVIICTDESNLSKKIFGVNSQKTSQPIDSDDKVNSDETSLDVAIPVSGNFCLSL